MEKRKFFASLESLRGVAALLVVFFHIPAWNEAFFTTNFVRNGYLMVLLFFVLSGFVLSHSYGRQIVGRADFARFLVLRFGRLYPVHFVFLMFFLAVEIAKYIATEHLGVRISNSMPFRENSIEAFFEHLFLVQGLGFSANAITFNAPAWSISTEFFVYVLFGVSVLLLSRASFVRLSTLLVSAALAWIFIWPDSIGYFDGMVWCVSGFFTGCLAYEIFRGLHKHVLPTYLAVVVMAAFVAFLVIKERGAPAGDVLILVLSVMLVLILTLAPGGVVNSILQSRPLAWLGERSYSLYMCHYLVIWIASQTLRIFFKAPDVWIDGKFHARISTELTYVAYPVTIFATVAVAALSYRYLENPSRQLVRRLARRRTVPAIRGSVVASRGDVPPGIAEQKRII